MPTKNIALKAVILFIAFFSFNVSWSQDDDVEFSNNIEFLIPSPVPENHQRIYITRTLGNPHLIDIPKSSEQIAKDVAVLLFVPPIMQEVKYPYSPFGKMYGYLQKLDLYQNKNNQMTPLLTLFGNKRVSHYIDLAENAELDLAMGVYLSSYEPDIGMTKVTAPDDAVLVLLMAQQLEKPNEALLDAYGKALEKEAAENFDDSYSFPVASGKWGFTKVHLTKEDADFCKSFHGRKMSESDYVKALKGYAHHFLAKENKSEYSKNFTLACVAIAKATPVPELPKRFKRRSKEIAMSFMPYLAHVTEAEKNAEPLILTKQR